MELPHMEFPELADLRLFLRELRDRQVETLSLYYDEASCGFYHRHNQNTPGRFSKSSTATCVLSLIAAEQWGTGPWQSSADKLVDGLLKTPWKSAGLDEDNVFTVSFILEAVTELLQIEAAPKPDALGQEKLEKAREILITHASRGPLSVQGYPPSAYVTQLVIRTMRKQAILEEATRNKISEWAEKEINRQIVLLSHNDKIADVFQLSYAIILLTNLVEPDVITPDQEFITEAALEEIFTRQRDDGTWPLSRPLFHYPELGSAHCYDYEMLVQLLEEPRLVEKLLRYVPRLARSARALQSYFPLGLRGAGWSSGHHPQLKGPESWSTASVYHFSHAFERLIAEQIRRETFSALGAPYEPPKRPKTYSNQLPKKFLDCSLSLDGQSRSLRDVVSTAILVPLISEEQRRVVEMGGALSKETPVSIILFGPPGTSKTGLARTIADTLGWPLLTIDASQFLKNGMDGVYAEADSIFGMLAVAERIIVLLDEFDEMVRAREIATDVLSRFLTTAMLPKLHKINDNRRLVFLVATNHIEAFDVAIRRPGRFDVILQVMPPTAEEKIRKWDQLSHLIGSGTEAVSARAKLEALTFTETEILARQIGQVHTVKERRKLLSAAYKKCTLLSPTNPDKRKSKNWATICEEQGKLSRVL